MLLGLGVVVAESAFVVLRRPVAGHATRIPKEYFSLPMEVPVFRGHLAGLTSAFGCALSPAVTLAAANLRLVFGERERTR